jgi:hypothetical protein
MPCACSPEGTLLVVPGNSASGPRSPALAGAEDQNGFQPYALGYVELAGPGDRTKAGSRRGTISARLSVRHAHALKLDPFRKAGGDVLAYDLRTPPPGGELR